MPTEKRPAPRVRRGPVDEAPDPYGRLIRYEITGLFGQHDHAFDLELEEPTILTGANGTGKSTILRTINAVGTGRWVQLLPIPFKSVTLRFENAPPVRVTKGKPGFKFEHGGDEWRWDPNGPEGAVALERRQMELFQAEYAELFDRDPARVKREVLRRVREHSFPEGFWAKDALHDAPDFMRRVPAGFSVRYVTDQRLVIYGDRGRPRPGRDRSEDVRAAVVEYAQDLRMQIGRELARYAAASQRQDREFPQLVVQAMSAGEDINLSDVRELLDAVGKRRQALERVGLLESDVGSVPQFRPESLELENVSPVIKTFAEVTLRKFDTLEPFRRRLQLFVDFLDQHFVEKRAVTTDERGLMFELSDGARVQPSELELAQEEAETTRHTIERAEVAIAELMTIAGVEAVQELADVERRAERLRLLRSQLPAIETRIAQAGQAPLGEIIERTASVDLDALDAEVETAETELAELEEQLAQFDIRLGELRTERQSMERTGGAAAARQLVEERRAELRELVERYLRVQIAAWALTEAIDEYRRDHKDPLLRRTDELFPQLTCGSFNALEVGFDEADEPVLVGVRPNGERVPVERMSTGTREQLYLALRLASLERHVQLHGPMPVILDDVVLHSDPRRKSAILTALAELERSTQVIAFSHDPQVVALAQSALDPDLVTMHELGGRDIPDALHPATGAADVHPIRRPEAA